MTRDVHEIKHEVYAVGSSSSIDSAKAFVEAVGANSSTKCYGNYEELADDSNIDVIYVASSVKPSAL